MHAIAVEDGIAILVITVIVIVKNAIHQIHAIAVEDDVGISFRDHSDCCSCNV